MSLTINLVLFKRKKRSNGEIPIYLRITENRKSRYKSTGIAVLPKYWNANRQEIRATHEHHTVLNRRLSELKLKAEKARTKLEHEEKLDVDALKNQMKKEAYNSLINCAERYSRQLEQDHRYWERKRFDVLMGQLKEYLGNKSINVTKVDAAFIEGFQQYLLTQAGKDSDGNRVGNSPNTVRRKLRSLKALFTHLIKNKTIKHDPFLLVEKVKEEPVEKTKLSLKQIEAIENLDLEQGSELWHTRNYFLYSFYNAGIRFGDLCTLKWENLRGERLSYKMRKTGGLKNIKQLEPMKRILSYYQTEDAQPGDYIFPILEKPKDDPIELQKAISSKNVIVNRHLKDLAGRAKIPEKISFHVARHSFSQMALESGKMNLYQISKALGHSKLKTTERYLKSFDEDLLDEGMSNLFGNE